MYNLRRKQTFLLPTEARMDNMKKSITFKAVSLWNSLDNDVRAISNINTFKCLVKKMSFKLV